MKTEMITLNSLEKLYLVAHQRTKDNKKKILEKIKHLEKFLARR